MWATKRAVYAGHTLKKIGADTCDSAHTGSETKLAMIGIERASGVRDRKGGGGCIKHRTVEERDGRKQKCVLHMQIYLPTDCLEYMMI